MIMNGLMLESMILERHQQLQREAEQKQMLVGLPHHSVIWYLLGRLGTLFVAIGTGIQQLVHPDQSTVCDGTQDGMFRMKGHAMNTQVQAEEPLVLAPSLDTDALDRNKLAQCGFTAEESAALLWLRSWYQSGGSDRMEIVRHWEFLKFLVLHGRLEV
jgi:hypothetical protein